MIIDLIDIIRKRFKWVFIIRYEYNKFLIHSRNWFIDYNIRRRRNILIYYIEKLSNIFYSEVWNCRSNWWWNNGCKLEPKLR